MTRYFRALRLRTAADRRVNAKIPVRCALAANTRKAPAHCTPAAKTRKRLRAALSPQTRENACALCSRRKHAKTTAHCALAANTRKAPAHRRVPFVRSSPCVIAPSRSPYFGHFAKALQNVSKVRCSLVWAIMNSSAETLAVLAVRRRSVLFQLMRHAAHGKCLQPAEAIFLAVSRGTCDAQAFCTFSAYATWLCGMLYMENACRRDIPGNFSRYLRRAGVCISTVVRRIFTAHTFAAYSISII